MALIILQPTSNESPDSGFGGSAVTTPSNTGHASTTSAASPGALQDKSCRWFGFPAAAGQVVSATLKITHTSTGLLGGPGAANEFLLQYSVNGGGAWTIAVQRDVFNTLQGPTV